MRLRVYPLTIWWKIFIALIKARCEGDFQIENTTCEIIDSKIIDNGLRLVFDYSNFAFRLQTYISNSFASQ